MLRRTVFDPSAFIFHPYPPVSNGMLLEELWQENVSKQRTDRKATC